MCLGRITNPVVKSFHSLEELRNLYGSRLKCSSLLLPKVTSNLDSIKFDIVVRHTIDLTPTSVLLGPKLARGHGTTVGANLIENRTLTHAIRDLATLSFPVWISKRGTLGRREWTEVESNLCQ
jgi:hypothetical protein